MIESEQDLPQDIESLKVLTLDLSRRLQNAQHTIDAERKIAQTALQQAEYYRSRLAETTQAFRMESARIRHVETKVKFDEEAKRYEENKVKGTTLHDQLRLMELDYQMTGFQKFVPLKLTKMRQKVKHLEQQQESQKLLLQQYSELFQVNEALINAVQHNDISQVMSLLQSGAEVNYMDHAGYLSIHYACSEGYYDIVQCLLDYGSDFSTYLTGHSPLVLAAKRGHINVIKLLLQHGANIEEKGSANCSALVAAMEQQQIPTVEYLIQCGANINSTDMHENTALHLATRLPQEHLHIIEYLKSMGASLEKVNKKEQNAGQMALYEKNKVAAFMISGHPLEYMEEEPDPNANNQSSVNPPVPWNSRYMRISSNLPVSKSNPQLTSTNTFPSKKVESIKAIKQLNNQDQQHALQELQMQQHQHQYIQQSRSLTFDVQDNIQQAAKEEVAGEMLLGGDLEDQPMELITGGALDGGPSMVSSLPFTASHSIASSVTFD